MRTTILIAFAVFLTSPIADAVENSSGPAVPLVPVTVRAVHLQVGADAAAELKLEGRVQTLQEQALKDAQSESSSVRRSFLLTTLAGSVAMAQTGRLLQVVVGQQTQSPGRVIQQTTSVQVGTLLKITPKIIGQQMTLEVSYECSELEPSDQEEARPDIRTLTLQTTLAMESDKPQLVKLRGDRDVDYLVIWATWDAQSLPQITSKSEERDGDRDGREQVILLYSRALINKYDTNHDGVLVADEWSAMRGGIEEADADKDGKITAVEMARFKMR